MNINAPVYTAFTQHQPTGLNRLNVRCIAGDEPYLIAGLCQHTAHGATQCAGSDNDDLHVSGSSMQFK
jgi:hypothetical protein